MSSQADVFLETTQFVLGQDQKEELLVPSLQFLHNYHREHCAIYDHIAAAGGLPNPEAEGIASVPYLPVRSFKELTLSSIPEDKIAKILTSSGTTGQNVSRIILDAENATLQQKALSSVMQTILGSERLPMLIVDTKDIISNRKSFTARAAGVLGMMTFGRQQTWLLDSEMHLDKTVLKEFLAKYGGEPFFIFGFTFMAWKYLLQAVEPSEFDLSNAILVHSGGWKKLQDEAVDSDEFNRQWRVKTGISNTRNFYGMVEQIGSIYVEGDDGWLYAPNYSDFIIRNPEDWSVQPHGVPGVIQVLSALPTSYPGFSLLTEDIGVSAPPREDGSLWKGARLKVLGRLPKAELRGCSDTHAAVAGSAS